MNKTRRCMWGVTLGLVILTVQFTQADVPVVSFTGSDSYALVGTPAALQIPNNQPFTFESWVYLRTVDVRDILYSKNSVRTSPYTYMFGFIDNGKLSAYNGSVWMQPSPAVTVNTGRWYHVAFSFNGTTMSYFLDGQSVGSSAFSFINTSAHTVKIGGYSSNADINGMQSEVRIWNVARTQAEIQAYMQRRLIGDEPGLLGNWPLNEGTGTLVADASTNSSDGTLLNATWTTGTLDFNPVLTLVNPLTGSEAYINTNELEALFAGSTADFDQYLFTQADGEPTGGWLTLDPTNPPTTVAFAVPDPEGPVTIHAWFRNSTGAVPAYCSSDTITYIRQGATITPLASDITRTLFGTNQAVIHIRSLEAGSSSSPLAIHRMMISCPADLTPERDEIVTFPNPGASNDVPVTLTVMDEAGNTASVGATVTLLVDANDGPYIWNGAGVNGGTGDSLWLWGDNWRVHGIVPASPPSLDDDAEITLNSNHVETVAVVVGEGARGRHVNFNGMGTTGRRLEFTGDAMFSTLDYSTEKNTLDILADATLTLTGGSIDPATDAVIKPTLITPSALGPMYSSLAYPGTIRFTGNQVALQFVGAVDGRMYIDNPDATVHFCNTILGMGGNLYVYGSQRTIGFNTLVGMRPLRYSDDLISQDGSPLTNWYPCHIGALVYSINSGSPFTIPAGTYQSIAAAFDSSYNGNVMYDISGDVTLCGANAAGDAVYVQRRKYSGGVLADGADFALNSNRLTVTGGGRIRIGEFVSEGSVTADPVWWNRIRAQGAAMVTDGGIEIGPGGYIMGDAETTIRLAGHWDNRSRWQTNNFTLEASTLILEGAAVPAHPQRIEAQSYDAGPTVDGMVRNHALGRLEIGTTGQATHAKLVDVDDLRTDGAADAMYVGELWIGAGSVLDIAGLNLYVNGVSVSRRWTEFGPGLIIDSTRPKGSLILFR